MFYTEQETVTFSLTLILKHAVCTHYQHSVAMQQAYCNSVVNGTPVCLLHGNSAAAVTAFRKKT